MAGLVVTNPRDEGVNSSKYVVKNPVLASTGIVGVRTKPGVHDTSSGYGSSEDGRAHSSVTALSLPGEPAGDPTLDLLPHKEAALQVLAPVPTRVISNAAIASRLSENAKSLRLQWHQLLAKLAKATKPSERRPLKSKIKLKEKDISSTNAELLKAVLACDETSPINPVPEGEFIAPSREVSRLSVQTESKEEKIARLRADRAIERERFDALREVVVSNLESARALTNNKKIQGIIDRRITGLNKIKSDDWLNDPDDKRFTEAMYQVSKILRHVLSDQRLLRPERFLCVARQSKVTEAVRTAVDQFISATAVANDQAAGGVNDHQEWRTAVHRLKLCVSTLEGESTRNNQEIVWTKALLRNSSKRLQGHDDFIALKRAFHKKFDCQRKRLRKLVKKNDLTTKPGVMSAAEKMLEFELLLKQLPNVKTIGCMSNLVSKYLDGSREDFVGSRGFFKADTKTALEECRALVRSFKASHMEFADDLQFEGYTPNKEIEPDPEDVHLYAGSVRVSQQQRPIAPAAPVDPRQPSPLPFRGQHHAEAEAGPPPRAAVDARWVGFGQ